MESKEIAYLYNQVIESIITCEFQRKTKQFRRYKIANIKDLREFKH